MSSSEKQQYHKDLLRGLELAEYRMLRDKAMHNETIIQGDGNGGWREVSAREVFVKLYNEPVPTFWYSLEDAALLFSERAKPYKRIRKMIKHDGIIIALNGDGTTLVRIVQTSACAARKAKAMCASAESAEKEMTVVLLGENGKVKTENNSTQSYHVGDTVEVMVQQKMGWKAVVLAYLFPFFVMLAVMFIGNGLLGDGATGLLGDEAKREAVLGTVALCAMALYYLVLGMFKDKLQKEFSFTAKKKNN